MGSHDQQRQPFARCAMVLTGQGVWKERITGGIELSFIKGDVFILGGAQIKRTEQQYGAHARYPRFLI
jgi:hypothetical protein